MWIEEKRQVPVKGETAVWKKEKKKQHPEKAIIQNLKKCAR